MSDTLVRWQQQFSTGLPWQDADHRGLMDAMHHTHDLLLNDPDAACRYVIDYLGEFVVQHFEAEEAEMLRLGITNTEDGQAHIAAHGQFIANLADLQSAAADGDSAQLAVEICIGLNDWFLNHIATFDRSLARLIVMNNLRQGYPDPMP